MGSTATALVPAAESGVAPVADGTLLALRTVKAVLAPDLSDAELQLFAMVADRSGLDPFAKQIHAVKRQGRVTFQTGIDGYRSTAARTGEYDGSDEPEFGPIIDQPFPHPEWAKVTVYRIRNGKRRGQPATAWWSEFCPADGANAMWRKMPRNQLAKCAEALAFRKAFPKVLADVYTDDEMGQAGPPDNPAMVAAAKLPTASQRLAARRAALQAAPAATEPAEAPAGDESPADDDVIEGEASEVPAGLTKAQLLAALKEAGISADYAGQVARQQFGLEEGQQLTDAQRAELLASLTAPDAL